jgi:ribosomal protein L11 methyltransferase
MKILYEVLFEVQLQEPSADLVRAALSGLGVALADIVEESGKDRHKISVFFADPAAARRLIKAFKVFGLKGVRVKMRVHRRTDWETRWKEGWKPFSLTRKIHVIPLFLKDAKCPKGKTPFYLDTTAAFGTGLHETTRFSARLIEGLRGRFKTALDIGTGTGILAAVALMSGATYVEAFDIDAGAVSVARKNLKANGLRCAVLKACDVQKYRSFRKFDLVAANLITHDLVAFKRKIIASVRPGGHLIISGISLKNMPLVKREYAPSVGLKCVKVLKGKEWAAFLFKKRMK